KATTDVASATISFETKYERHAGPPQPARIVEAQRILDMARDGGITSSPAGTLSGDLYILGDSITVRAADTYKDVLGSKNINAIISAVSGRSWKTAGDTNDGAEGTTGTGEEAAEADKDAIASSSGIVIALGTNG